MKISDYMKDTGMGSGSDRTTFDSKGQRKSHGAAVGYEDLATTLGGKLLGEVRGKADWDWDRHAVKFESGGDITDVKDKVGSEHQYPHSAKTDGSMYYHAHWIMTDSYATMPVQFTFRHRIHSNGAEENLTWVTTVVEANDTNNVFAYDGETGLVQITVLKAVDMTGASISAMVDWEFARTDSESGDVYVKYVDPHYINDTDGSNTEYVKDEGA